MKISKIRDLPTELTWAYLDARRGSQGFHESLLRAYHIVEKVKELLKLGTPQEVILEIIEEIEQ